MGAQRLSGTHAVRIPPRRFAKHFVVTARTELTDQIPIFGERHLRIVLAAYGTHYNRRRPHRTLQLQLPRPIIRAQDLNNEADQRRPVVEGSSTSTNRQRDTVSGEHGVDLLKRAGLHRELGPGALALHDAVKQTFDPHRI